MNRHILEWYKDLPEPYRSQAIENYSSNFWNSQANSITQAIHNGFKWSRSPQGLTYWQTVFVKLGNGTLTLLPSYNKYLKNA